MEKKSLNLEEFFCGMPRLYAYFSRLEREIKRYSPNEGQSEGVEELKKKKKALMQTAKGIDCMDLQILYYLHRLQRVRPMQLFYALKRIVDAQDALSSLPTEE